MSGLAEQTNGWRPAPATDHELLGPEPARALAPALDTNGAGHPVEGLLPPLWHWSYFLRWPAASELGTDGHLAGGGFLPPITSRRRMFAGGRLWVAKPLVLGKAAQRTAWLLRTEVKNGRSGQLLFTTVRSEISQRGEVVIVEEQDLVYRSADAAQPSPPPSRVGSAEATSTGADAVAGQPPPPSSSSWRAAFCADPVLLLRFSALTANAHRIHDDRRYAEDVEGFSGLAVHGPLLVLLMTEVLRRHEPTRRITTMHYRPVRPLLAGEPAAIIGVDERPTVHLAVLGPDDSPRAEATVECA